MKSESPRELMLAFACGLKPKDMIAKGYNEKTVYRYSVYFKKAQIKFREKWGE